MDKVDYRVLDSRELLSLAKKIEDALDESVSADGDDSAYKLVEAEIERIRKDLSDNPRELSIPVGEIKGEIDRRLSEGRGTVGRFAMVGDGMPDPENGSNRFSISLMIGDEGWYNFDWETAKKKNNGNHERGFRRQGDEKGFPDQELLKSSPFEWLARYLKRTDLYEEVFEYEDVDYDEGF